MLGDRLWKYSLRSVRGLVALLFVVSGVGKLIDGQSAAYLTQRILGGALGPMGAQVLVGVVSCGCYGAFSLELSLEATILRNLVVLALALVGFLLADVD